MIIGIILVTLFGCTRQPAATRELVIGMQKTICYGSCPAYSIQIFSDLSVVYKGERFVPVEGEHIYKIKRVEFEDLLSAFRGSDFFEFNSDYTKGVSDLQTTYIEFYDEGKVKKIRDYYGAPEELKALERKVEEFVERRIWEKKIN